MRGSYNAALYTVLQGAIDGEILLLPVLVRHVENARMVAYTMIYSSVANNIQSY